MSGQPLKGAFVEDDRELARQRLPRASTRHAHRHLRPGRSTNPGRSHPSSAPAVAKTAATASRVGAPSPKPRNLEAICLRPYLGWRRHPGRSCIPPGSFQASRPSGRMKGQQGCWRACQPDFDPFGYSWHVENHQRQPLISPSICRHQAYRPPKSNLPDDYCNLMNVSQFSYAHLRKGDPIGEGLAGPRLMLG